MIHSTKYHNGIIKYNNLGFSNKNTTNINGKWNLLIAKNLNGEFLGAVEAHDGDFFPESVEDYISEIRKMVQIKDKNCTITPPIRVDIDITQKCNARCVFCFSRNYQTTLYRNHDISHKNLERIFSELSEIGTKSVRFCGGGEPLSHPEIDKILRLPDKYGFLSCLISSLDLINDKIALLIIDNISHLRWSVNASSNSTRNLLHRPRKNSRPLTEINNYVAGIARNRKKKNQGPMIWATYLIHPDNYHEIIDATYMLQEIGVDSLSFRPIFFENNKKWTNKQLKELDILLSKVKKMNFSPGFSLFITKHNISNSYQKKPTNYFSNCLSSMFRTVIEASSNGAQLQICGLHRGKINCHVPTLNTKRRLSDIWKKSLLEKKTRRYPRGCDRCIDISMNVTLNFIFNKLLEEPSTQFFRAFGTVN